MPHACRPDLGAFTHTGPLARYTVGDKLAFDAAAYRGQDRLATELIYAC